MAEQTDEPERFGLGEFRNQLRVHPNLSPGYPERSAVRVFSVMQRLSSMMCLLRPFLIIRTLVFFVALNCAGFITGCRSTPASTNTHLVTKTLENIEKDIVVGATE